MNMIIAISFILFAGIISGSYIVPVQYVPKWKFENIWLNFAIWTFIIFPVLTIIGFAPEILEVYTKIPANLLIIIVICGLICGVGQVCFAKALNIIGIGLDFVIDLGIGIGLGFLLPLIIQYPHKIFTPFGYVTLIGTALSLFGLLVSSYAGILRDRHKHEELSLPNNKKNFYTGIVLAIVAGVGCAAQNFAFSYTFNIQLLAVQLGVNKFISANIIWPSFLLCAAVPYVVYMLFLHKKNNSFINYFQKGIGIYHLFGIIMALLFYGSLLIYCKASQLIGSFGPIIGWPIFMVAIIFTSNFWGWRYGEWKNCGKEAENKMKFGLMLLVLSVVILGLSSIL